MTAHRNFVEPATTFVRRHIGPSPRDIAAMLETVGAKSLGELMAQTLPSPIRQTKPLDLGAPLSETEALAHMKELALQNQVFTSLIGRGYSGTILPGVIQRNILENPAWYTAYTPYQPEISQGRLEALLNFQTMVSDLTGMDVANASMLDEATAAAEAMTLLHRANRGSSSARLLIDTDLFPQTRTVLYTRAEPLGIEIVEADLSGGALPEGEFFGVLLQAPGASGRIVDWTGLIAAAHERGALVAAGADLLEIGRAHV